MEHRNQGKSFEAAVKDWPPGAALVRKEWEKYAWPGGYPLFYMTTDGGCLCPTCANENVDLTLTDDPQWGIKLVDINWEDKGLFCDNCQKPIESAYGNDDEGEEDGNPEEN
jgi:hypothetical protein